MSARARRALLLLVAVSCLAPPGVAVAESPTGPAPNVVGVDLDDRISVSVNVASGNLFLSQRDDSLTTSDGTVWDQSRYYNSMGQIELNFAPGWSGRETVLRFPVAGSDNTVVQVDVGGYQRTFTKSGSTFVNQQDDGYVLAYTPPGGTGTYQITQPDGTVRSYWSNGPEISEVRPGGHQVTNSGDYGLIETTWEYSDGPGIHMFYGWYGQINGYNDLHDREQLLGVDHAHQSTLIDGHTHADGRVTTYEYLPYYQPAPGATAPDGPFMTRVTTSLGVDARFQYDTSHRVTQLKVIDPVDASEDIWGFAYTVPDDECSTGATVKTTVTYPNGHTEYTCSNASFDVTDADSDGPIDLGDGDDGACTTPLDCGEGDLSPEDVALPEPSARNTTPSGFGIADDTRVTDFNIFTTDEFKALDVKYVRHIVPWNVALNHHDGPNDPTGELEDAAIWAANALASNDLADGTVVPGPEILFSFEKCHELKPANGTQCAKLGNIPGVTGPGSYVDLMSSFFTQVGNALPGSLLAPLKQVTLFTAWNEPNLEPTSDPTSDRGQPVASIHHVTSAADETNSGAFRAGLFWQQLNAICKNRTPGCAVLAGDFADLGMGSVGNRDPNWGKKYLEQYRLGMGHKPKTWAWHAYEDTDQRVTPKTQTGVSQQDKEARRWKRYRAFEKATRIPGDDPTIHITEVGVRRRVNGKARLVGNVDRAMRCLLAELPDLSLRNRRFYYYSFIGNPNFDAGLVAYPDGLPTRTAYDLFKDAREGNPITCPVAP
ncbi:hypothetical protein OJ997_00180 [Solirubrobacter phytolaccae]|uniref:Uncharacterized protein n=1 Tax=Solirubrobacter phytolaccae TaxID=1404360 RepID=A0A9X3N326_9ACTN|nr:hypothetical protein [Solirubrobacter phytolaccae]MDA0178694.1 hypothetical protein [Solirubrobacter phytolaccae]